MITFDGVYAQSLGGFSTIRGYAWLSELEQYSEVDEKYQRDIMPQHRDDIKDFYERKEYLFYPEIVLSLELLVDYEKAGAPEDDPISLISKGKGFKSNMNGVTVKIYKRIGKSEFQRASISVPEKNLNLFKRIDGNHRLEAYALIDDSGSDMLAPFCIILFPMNKAIMNEQALFYNINSKSLVLTPEEIYKGIIDDATGFPDDVLERDFGPAFVKCRTLYPKLDFTYLTNISKVFGKEDGDSECGRALLIHSLQTFKKFEGAALPKDTDFFSAIKQVNDQYADSRLTSSRTGGLFTAFLCYALKAGSLPTLFMNWVIENHIYELEKVEAEDLIRIFDKISLAKHRQIFVSMDFSEDKKTNYKAIKAAANEINREYHMDIKLREIRIDKFKKGYSYKITDEILTLLEESGLLIADLTGGNKNVYHEIGYLMGLNQGKGRPQTNFILLHNKSIGDAKRDIGFNLTETLQLRVKDADSLKKQVKEQIKIYYGLSNS